MIDNWEMRAMDEFGIKMPNVKCFHDAIDICATKYGPHSCNIKAFTLRYENRYTYLQVTRLIDRFIESGDKVSRYKENLTRKIVMKTRDDIIDSYYKLIYDVAVYEPNERDISILELPVRVLTILRKKGINTLEDLSKLSYSELCNINGIRNDIIDRIVSRMQIYGLENYNMSENLWKEKILKEFGVDKIDISAFDRVLYGGRIKPRQVHAIELYYRDGLSYADIAKTVGSSKDANIPISRVQGRSLVKHGISRLKWIYALELNSHDIDDSTHISMINMSSLTTNSLIRANISTIGQLRWMTDDELRSLRNVGEKSIREIHEKLESIGIWVSPPKSEMDEIVESINMSFQTQGIKNRLIDLYIKGRMSGLYDGYTEEEFLAIAYGKLNKVILDLTKS